MNTIINFSSPCLWIALTLSFVIIYSLIRKKAGPKFIDIGKILSDYRKIYIHGLDLAFSIIVPLFLAIATSLEKPMDKDMADLLCVVISILAAAVISFMAMTSDRFDGVQAKENKNVGDHRSQIQCTESLSIGLFETLLSVVLLIFIFVRPIVQEHEIVGWIFGTAIYALFYQFLFNLLIMMRRLRQIYK